MSDFELRDEGDGRFVLNGAMSFETADRILRASAESFQGYDAVEVDFSGVNDADSAGLALLIEWKSWNQEIRFNALPRSIQAIARTADVEHLL